MSAKSEMNKSSKSLFAENIDSMFEEKKKVVTKKWAIDSKPKTKVGFYNNYYIDNNYYNNYHKPVKISDQLAVFISKKRGIEMRPNDVEKEIIKYIRINNLICTHNSDCFNLDFQLINLFNLSSSQKIDRYMLKSMLKQHFTKLDEKIQVTKPDENIQFKIQDEDDASGTDTDDDADSDQAIVPEPPLVPIDNINLCFVGGVSTGKSTILNAI